MTNGRANCRALSNSCVSTLSGAEPARLGSLVAAALAIIRVIQAGICQAVLAVALRGQ